MTALTFIPKLELKFTLDASVLIPDKLKALNLSDIRKIKLDYGNQHVNAGELFKISGNDSTNIHFRFCTEKVIRIGQNMTTGMIEVFGNAGDYLGKEMQNGKIIVHGSAGDWTGCSMKNGYIEISGDVGEYLGAGVPGDPHGMSNGHIIVLGDAGDRVGDRMRRGTIIIHGKAGDYCGSRMFAGSIIVLDKAGKYIGYSMRRGSIILAKKPKHISSTFKSCGYLKMQYLRLLFPQLISLGGLYSIFEKYGPEAHRFAGDMASNGKGEILILQTIRI